MNLSIVIPVYNERKTLKKLLSKVLKQREVSKVVVIDDGSTDGSSEILKKIRSKKVKVFFHKWACQL